MATQAKGTKGKNVKPATAADVAALAGVNRSSVSVVLNGAKANTGVSAATRERILKAAAELNYTPDPHAQRLAGRRTQDIVAIFNPQIHAGTTLNKILAIQQQLELKGFHAPLYCGGSWEQVREGASSRMLRQLRSQRPSAIVCFTMTEFESIYAELQQFQNEGGFVLCYDYEVDLKCDQVIFDRAHNTYIAAKHLLELGHRHVGFFNSGVRQAGNHHVNSRPCGFQRAMHEFNAEIRPDWLFEGYSTEERGAMLAAQFLALKEKPTAMCIVNEVVTWAFIHEIERAGIQVPQNLSIVSHDNLPIARYTTPPLTTASHPVEDIATHLAELVSHRLNGVYDGLPQKITIQGELVKRESAIPPS